MMTIKRNIALLILVLCTFTAFAQKTDKKDPEVTFNPHWFLQAQGGVAHTVGEASFGDLLSPTAALSFGYRFTPVWGIRAGVDGWRARGSLPEISSIYKYSYLQGNIEVMVDLSNWWGGYRYNRFFDAYIFAGVAGNERFRNGEAASLYDSGYSDELEYFWRRKKFSVAGKAGIGANLRLSNHVAINIEVNGDMLTDKFNSKKAKNVDWQLNGVIGLTFSFGKTHKRTVTPAPEPAPAPAPAPVVEPTPVVEPAPEPAPVAPAITNVTENVFFLLNSAELRSSEISKIDSVAAFLIDNENVTVAICGYADAETGNATINKRLSKQRAEVVAEALKAKGVAADRITVDYKGDTVQPFPTPEQNRVAIVIAE